MSGRRVWWDGRWFLFPKEPVQVTRLAPLPRQAPGALLLFWCLCSLSSPGHAQAPVPVWSLAGPYPAEGVNRKAYPNFYAIFLAPWQEVWAGPEGLVDLNLHLPRDNTQGNLAIARHVFSSLAERPIDLHLVFAGDMDVFFNRRRVFSGHREEPLSVDESGGGLTRSDRIPLDVKKGLNEIFLLVSSETEPWAFQAGTAEPLPPKTRAHELATEVWSTPDVFLTPESVLKDPNRNVLYVTSFDNEYAGKPEPSGYISKLSPDGEIQEERWVEGLHAPTGMDVWKDTLYVAEREDLLAIELASGEIAGLWPIPDPVFPNDLVIDGEGTVYISDTRTGDWPDSRIYRFREGQFDVFANEGINGANGLWIHDGWLIVGSSGDGLLKRLELSTGRMENIVSLGAGIIDGIRVDPEGNYLVSHWEGQLYRISPRGEVVELLDALPDRWNTADFEYLPEENLILVPTFLDNRVRAIRIGG